VLLRLAEWGEDHRQNKLPGWDDPSAAAWKFLNESIEFLSEIDLLPGPLRKKFSQWFHE
jgi:hypothetical protein